MVDEAKLPDLIIENARVFYRNFMGRKQEYNNEGDRNFCVGLDPNLAEDLRAQGWNVKQQKVREEGEEPRYYMQVAVRFDRRPPKIMLITNQGKKRTLLDEETCAMLDFADISNWDLVINPSRWDVNGNKGIKAYLKGVFATMDENALDIKYALDDEDQDPTVGLSSTANEEVLVNA